MVNPKPYAGGKFPDSIFLEETMTTILIIVVFSCSSEAVAIADIVDGGNK